MSNINILPNHLSDTYNLDHSPPLSTSNTSSTSYISDALRPTPPVPGLTSGRTDRTFRVLNTPQSVGRPIMQGQGQGQGVKGMPHGGDLLGSGVGREEVSSSGSGSGLSRMRAVYGGQHTRGEDEREESGLGTTLDRLHETFRLPSPNNNHSLARDEPSPSAIRRFELPYHGFNPPGSRRHAAPHETSISQPLRNLPDLSFTVPLRSYAQPQPWSVPAPSAEEIESIASESDSMDVDPDYDEFIPQGIVGNVQAASGPAERYDPAAFQAREDQMAWMRGESDARREARMGPSTFHPTPHTSDERWRPDQRSSSRYGVTPVTPVRRPHTTGGLFPNAPTSSPPTLNSPLVYQQPSNSTSITASSSSSLFPSLATRTPQQPPPSILRNGISGYHPSQPVQSSQSHASDHRYSATPPILAPSRRFNLDALSQPPGSADQNAVDNQFMLFNGLTGPWMESQDQNQHQNHTRIHTHAPVISTSTSTSTSTTTITITTIQPTVPPPRPPPVTSAYPFFPALSFPERRPWPRNEETSGNGDAINFSPERRMREATERAASRLRAMNNDAEIGARPRLRFGLNLGGGGREGMGEGSSVRGEASTSHDGERAALIEGGREERVGEGNGIGRWNRDVQEAVSRRITPSARVVAPERTMYSAWGNDERLLANASIGDRYNEWERPSTPVMSSPLPAGRRSREVSSPYSRPREGVEGRGLRFGDTAPGGGLSRITGLREASAPAPIAPSVNAGPWAAGGGIGGLSTRPIASLPDRPAPTTMAERVERMRLQMEQTQAADRAERQRVLAEYVQARERTRLRAREIREAVDAENAGERLWNVELRTQGEFGAINFLGDDGDGSGGLRPAGTPSGSSRHSFLQSEYLDRAQANIARALANDTLPTVSRAGSSRDTYLQPPAGFDYMTRFGAADPVYPTYRPPPGDLSGYVVDRGTQAYESVPRDSSHGLSVRLQITDEMSLKEKIEVGRKIVRFVSKWEDGARKRAAGMMLEKVEFQEVDLGVVDGEVVVKEEFCAVCYDEYEEDSKIALTPCKHMYHKDCLDTWLDTPRTSSCPMCRRDLAVLSILSKMTPSKKVEDAMPIWMGL